MFSSGILRSVVLIIHGDDMIKKEASLFKDTYGKGSGKTSGTPMQLKLIFAVLLKSKPPFKLGSAPRSKSVHRFNVTLIATLKLSDPFKP